MVFRSDVLLFTDPTPYKVSTITAVATISTCIDLNLFFENVQIDALPSGEQGVDKQGVIVFAGKGTHGGARIRGLRPTKANARAMVSVSGAEIDGATTVRTPRFFDHQVTVIYSTCVVRPDGESVRETHNVKVFHNGNLQLTGVKSLEGGRMAVQHIADSLVHIASFCPDVLPLGLANAPPVPANFRACLINSDFNAGYVLRRDRLYMLVSGPMYAVRCVFETYYPGVKVQFMWNINRGKKQDGVCRCATPCTGKGDGSGNGNCRKVTLSVFQSGCCIITGAHTYAQLDDAHSFLTGVFVTHRTELARPTTALKPTSDDDVPKDALDPTDQPAVAVLGHSHSPVAAQGCAGVHLSCGCLNTSDAAKPSLVSEQALLEST